MSGFIWFEILSCIVNIHILLVGVLGGRLLVRRGLALFFTGVLPCLILVNIPESPFWDIAYALCFLWVFVLPLLTVRGVAKRQILYVSFFFTGLASAFAASCLWVVGLFYVGFGVLYAVSAILHAAMTVVCVLIAKKILFSKVARYIFLIPRRQKAFMLTCIWGGTIMAFLLIEMFYEFPVSIYLVVIQIICAVILVIVGILCPLWIAGTISSMHYQAVSDAAQKQIENQVQRYQQFIQANQDIRQFRHDFDNSKVAVLSHLKRGDIAAAIQCLWKLGQSINLDFFTFDTGSPVADALLSEKQGKAGEIGAQLTFEGAIPSSGIESIDLCVILGNLLDNALEACEKIKNPRIKLWVSVEAFFDNEFFFLAVKNPVEDDVPVQGSLPSSTKSDKASHGFGLYSVLTVAERYDGKLNLDCKDGVWTAKVEMDLVLEQEEEPEPALT